MYDFSKVEAPKQQSYLIPGTYMLHPTEVKLEEPSGKTAYLNITFSGNEGIVKQKFYLSAKALPNLVYLHENLFGKPITKAFESNAQVHAYFEKALTAKPVEKPFVVGATEADNGQLYSELPFGKFIVKDGTPYLEGAYEPGTPRYNEVVRKSASSASKTDLSSSSSLLPSSDDTDAQTGDDSMPW